MRGHLVHAQGRLGLPRPAGGARDREGARLQVEGRHRALRRGRVQRQVPRVGAALHRRVERAHRADRLLDRHRRRLLHARRTTTSSRSGGRSSRSGTRACSTEGHKVVPYCPRCGTALSSHEVALGLQGRGRPVACTCGSRCSTSPASRCSPGRRCRGRSCRTRRSPSTRTSPTCARGSATSALILAEALVERVLGEEAEIEERMPGLGRCSALRYEPPFPYITDYGERGHTVLAGDFVSIEDGTGVVHTGAAFGEDDFRLGQENGLTIHNPVRPDGTFDERTGPFAGMYVRDADAADRRGAARVGPAVPRRASTSTPTRTAGAATRRSSTTPRRTGTCAPPSVKDELLAANEDDRLVPRPHQARALRQVAREQRGLGAVARALLGHAAADLALRGRGPRGLRRLARRAARAAAASVPDDLHRPYIDEVVAALRAAAARCAACPT